MCHINQLCTYKQESNKYLFRKLLKNCVHFIFSTIIIVRKRNISKASSLAIDRMRRHRRRFINVLIDNFLLIKRYFFWYISLYNLINNILVSISTSSWHFLILIIWNVKIHDNVIGWKHAMGSLSGLEHEFDIMSFWFSVFSQITLNLFSLDFNFGKKCSVLISLWHWLCHSS